MLLVWGVTWTSRFFKTPWAILMGRQGFTTGQMLMVVAGNERCPFQELAISSKPAKGGTMPCVSKASVKHHFPWLFRPPPPTPTTTCHHALDLGQQQCSKNHQKPLMQVYQTMASDLNSFTHQSSPYESPHQSTTLTGHVHGWMGKGVWEWWPKTNKTNIL